jgi:glycosyltransferase involved in cell wall biosynthesis
VSKKIFYIFDANDWDSRYPLAVGARLRDHRVILGLIGGVRGQQTQGFDYHVIKKNQTLGPLALLDMARQVRSATRSVKPQILHAVTLKYAFICALASLPFKKMQKVYTLAGLGYLFYSPVKKAAFLRFILRPFLTYLFKRPNTTLIFQNPDDLELLVSKKYVAREHCILVRGSGVDLNRFCPDDDIPPDYPPVVLMPTRLVHDKGVAVFVEAARILKQRGIHASFQIAGGEGANSPLAISAEEMSEMVKDGAAVWLGKVSDMPGFLKRATLIVYPSYYGEGIPRVLLEACASGKAIVTTDHTGCREVVRHGYNGLLVPVRDVHETADAIHDLLIHANKRARMEENSRTRAIEEFDIHKIVAQTLDVYGRHG